MKRLRYCFSTLAHVRSYTKSIKGKQKEETDKLERKTESPSFLLEAPKWRAIQMLIQKCGEI